MLDERLDRLPGRDVNDRGGDVEAGVRHHGRRGLRVVLPQVGQDDVLARADSSGDGLPDGAAADDHDHLGGIGHRGHCPVPAASSAAAAAYC
ncbi:MAG TPA: hypothetical protein VNS83_01890, partial [Lapillicoccus sp.]|nr:hypothetical protein [Lapillicoccus sp.]